MEFLCPTGSSTLCQVCLKSVYCMREIGLTVYTHRCRHHHSFANTKYNMAHSINLTGDRGTTLDDSPPLYDRKVMSVPVSGECSNHKFHKQTTCESLRIVLLLLVSGFGLCSSISSGEPTSAESSKVLVRSRTHLGFHWSNSRRQRDVPPDRFCEEKANKNKYYATDVEYLVGTDHCSDGSWSGS